MSRHRAHAVTAAGEVVPRWRRTLGLLSALTCVAALAGSAQLVTGTYTPPVSDLEPLGLGSWVLPGLWLALSVAVPCGLTTVLAWRCSPWLGTAAMVAGGLLAVELAVQVPFVGLDPLQAVMGAVALALVGLGLGAHRSVSERRAWPAGVRPAPGSTRPS